MEILLTITWGIFYLLLLWLIYLFFQIKRDDATYDLKVKWLKRGDVRYDKYSYNYIFKPSKQNWYGLKMPKDSDFKK